MSDSLGKAVDVFGRTMNKLGVPATGDGVVYLDPGDRGDVGSSDEVMLCDQCKHTLNLLKIGGTETWIHSRSWENYDHDPVPRAVSRTSVMRQTCDFCGEISHLHWAFIGDRLRQGVEGNVSDFGTTWRACEACSVSIRAHDLDKLADRVTRVSILRDPEKRSVSTEIRQSLLNMWAMFFNTVHTQTYVGPRREPAKLHARMMPKLQMGLVKFWNSEDMRHLVTSPTRLNGVSHSLPGVHCGDETQFSVRFGPDQQIPESAWNNQARHLSAGILGSELFWISSDFTQLAIMAGKDFDKLIISREELPAPFGFMMYEQPIGEMVRPDGMAAIRGVSWTLVPGGIWLNLYVQGEDSAPDVDIERMRSELGYLLCPNVGSGLAFDTDLGIPSTSQFRFITTIFATWFLMTQPGIADQERAPVDKKYARSFQRQHQRKLPDVQLVDLRKQPHRSSPDTETREGRKLSVRVYRKGHWKRQAYGPKRGMRKTIYVNAYIAGPDGAPLKDRPATVKVLR